MNPNEDEARAALYNRACANTKLAKYDDAAKDLRRACVPDTRNPDRGRTAPLASFPSLFTSANDRRAKSVRSPCLRSGEGDRTTRCAL